MVSAGGDADFRQTTVAACILYLELGVGDDVLVVGVEESQHVAAVVGIGVPRPQRLGTVQKRMNRSKCRLQGRLAWAQGTFDLIEAQIVSLKKSNFMGGGGLPVIKYGRLQRWTLFVLGGDADFRQSTVAAC